MHPNPLKGRDFLKLLDFTKDEILYLISLACDLKKAKKLGNEPKRLVGKNIALLFEKTSTRTRCSFEVAAFDQGAHITYLDPTGSQIGHKESIADTARVLSRYYDGIQHRGFAHKDVEELAKYATVPVWNGLSNEYHPTQILADFLTIKENFCDLSSQKIVYVGDGRNNVAVSTMIGATKIGMDCAILAPKSLFPSQDVISMCQEFAKKNNSCLKVTDSMDEALNNASAIYTDVWVSMGEAASVWEERTRLLKPYQVNKAMMAKAKPSAIFLHCLPAFHDINTKVGKEIHEKYGLTEMEVTDEVFNSEASRVFDQAENRLHTIKAVMVATLS